MEEHTIFWDRRFGRNFLKAAAILTMLIDHIGYIFFGGGSDPQLYNLMRIIGRIAFPIICFQLAEGIYYTKNWKKYALRLAVFALLSEIPFDLAFYGKIVSLQHQNVLFTLLIALLVIKGMERFQAKPAVWYLIAVSGCILAGVMRTDYRYWGILMVVVFYYTKQNRLQQYFLTGLLLVLQGKMEAAGILAFPFLMAYDAEVGEKPFPRYFFYAFYPIHLLVLWAIYTLLG